MGFTSSMLCPRFVVSCGCCLGFTTSSKLLLGILGSCTTVVVLSWWLLPSMLCHGWFLPIDDFLAKDVVVL